ncbi:rhombotarget lipoprotein [Halioxenophilus sp. WMMB6]|uniref:rhombotarget lipoprotein n=1 Tax=Halioxenophilus sp. WMMB6 TaxID=3073815 RepID=UPI00295F3A38|nr:rhombotarget lipoprotein [Halioxenophilus sp. WMMB6]
MSFQKLLIAVAVCSMLLSGCTGMQTRAKSSVVDYLYPEGLNSAVEPSVPVLTLPVAVGIAFVPEQGPHTRSGINWVGQYNSNELTEKDKTDLLNRVADHFKSLEFVSHIEIIPTAYLRAEGSFANLEQIKSMFGVDVVALVSYDQIQFTDEGFLSLSYWTLVGAYMVSGERNDTNTLMDTAVYDIASRKLLFRAPGVSNVKGRSTPVNLSEELRVDSKNGFEMATDDMIVNLDSQLQNFRDKVKESPEQYQVVHSANYSGGGAVSWLELLLLSLVMVHYRWFRRSR